MAVKGVGGGNHSVQYAQHQHSHKTKSDHSTPDKSSKPPRKPPRNARTPPQHSPADLLAATRGFDSSRLLRARLEATLGTPPAHIATNAPAKRARQAQADPFNQRLPTNNDPDRRRAINPDRNRAVNPERREIGSDGNLTRKSFYFPIERNTHYFDGRGNDRGRINSGSVKLNYGQQKTINGQEYVYAFDFATDVPLTKNGRILTKPNGDIRYAHSSGWIPKAALKGDLENRINMPVENARRPSNDPGPHARYAITGGRPGEFGTLKVVPNSRKRNERATDYLNRGGVVNILYSLPGKGGVSTDTLPLGATFHRSNTVKPRAVRLYQPGSGEPVKKRMTFVYGYTKDPQTQERRYGWIAAAALGKQLKS